MMASPDQSNLKNATKDLNLTPQEQNLYNKHLDNLWGEGGVNNSDGSRSTLYASVEPRGSQYYVIPTVWNGARETQSWTRPEDGKAFDIPNETALSNVDKEGWGNYPSYSTPQEAESRYLSMHDYMEKDTQTYFNIANTGD